jgi:uncharacterized protein (DUF4415 family)
VSERDIDLSEIPEITEEQMKRATLRAGGKPVARGKVRVNMFLDADIVAYFKALAGGRGYQTLINEALRNSILAEDLEIMLSRVVRESLAEYVLPKPSSLETQPIEGEERASDPFFSLGTTTYDIPAGKRDPQAAADHDRVIYDLEDD